jgi:hypothetical protein
MRKHHTHALRVAGVTAATAALTLTATSAAWAHDCFNASRSQTGSVAAGTHSQAWFNLVIADAIADDVANELYTAEQGVCALAYWNSHDGPASVSFHVKGANGSDGVIASKNPNAGLIDNGKGIDEFGAAYGPLIGAAFESCGIDAPPDED